MACESHGVLGATNSKTLPVGKPAACNIPLRTEIASRSVKKVALRKKVVPASIKLSTATNSRSKHDLRLGVQAAAAAGVHIKCPERAHFPPEET